MYSKRPKYKPILTATDKFVSVFGTVCVIIMWATAVYFYSQVDETIPIHFNAAGEADNYGNRITLFLMPAIGTFIYVFMSALNNYPHLFNYLVEITEENAPVQYTLATRMVRYINIGMVLFFFCILCFMYLATQGAVVSIGIILALSSLFFLPIVVFFVKSFKATKQQ